MDVANFICAAWRWSGGQRHLAAGQGVNGLGRQRLTADGLVAALDFLDDAPRDAAHALAFDGDHRLGQVARAVHCVLGAESEGLGNTIRLVTCVVP